MPAKNLHREDKEGIYSHIYNKGIEKRIIFNDEKDYEVFQGFLKDYLTVPQDPKNIKKEFKVHGRIFRGTPHQPKNYFNKVELIAYSLMPNHFHLLLHQKTLGSLESFMRSLCTRYSMYFNKKYKHKGTLFEGPYKSVKVSHQSGILLLTHYFHREGDHSTYPEYQGLKDTPWVNIKTVLAIENKTGNYKDFVEKYVLSQEEEEHLDHVSIEPLEFHLERRENPTRSVENNAPAIPADSSGKIEVSRDLKPLQRMPEFLATGAVFLLLLTFGIRNIMVSTTKSLNPPSSPSVLSETKKVEDVKPKVEDIKPKIIVTVKTDDGVESVNIRQNPTVNSEKIGQAKNGDTFEFVSLDSKWYEVKLATGSGFISAAYIEVEEINE